MIGSSRSEKKYRLTQIGFSQRIKLEWLERTANLVLAGGNAATIYQSLQELLEDKVSVGSKAPRNNREKSVSILMRIWFSPPADLYHLQETGLNLLSRLPEDKHIAIHWGMTMAVYPFWGAVATQVGRLLGLQGTATHTQIRQRINEIYGQRTTVKVALRRVLRSMVDWGVLKDARPPKTNSEAIFVPEPERTLEEVELISWLAKAVLHTLPNETMVFRNLFTLPALFPFRLLHTPAEQLVANTTNLEVLRHGFDQDLLVLETV